MTVREQILDVLGNSGPKKMTDLVRILEEFDENNTKGNVHPVKSAVLYMLNSGELKMTNDRYLKIMPVESCSFCAIRGCEGECESYDT